MLVLESGGEHEDEDHAKLIEIENVGFLNDPKDIEARIAYHEIIPEFWSQEYQPFGVSCRDFGGSSQAWAGKSAASNRGKPRRIEPWTITTFDESNSLFAGCYCRRNWLKPVAIRYERESKHVGLQTD